MDLHWISLNPECLITAGRLIEHWGGNLEIIGNQDRFMGLLYTVRALSRFRQIGPENIHSMASQTNISKFCKRNDEFDTPFILWRKVNILNINNNQICMYIFFKHLQYCIYCGNWIHSASGSTNFWKIIYVTSKCLLLRLGIIHEKIV